MDLHVITVPLLTKIGNASQKRPTSKHLKHCFEVKGFKTVFLLEFERNSDALPLPVYSNQDVEQQDDLVNRFVTFWKGFLLAKVD